MSGRLTQFALRAMDRAAGLALHPPEQPEHLATGQRGEELAYFYLRRMGYVIVGRNYRSRRRRGEIDLVGWDGGVLCFIEVKTRTTREVKPAEAAVDLAKQRDLRAMAREYIRRCPSKPKPVPPTKPGLPGAPGRVMGNLPHRFDILSIYLLDGSDPEFTLFKNAFPVA
ncbi:MAG TPA: YraN family protein [Terriglobales bacterium]|jgi:putative endonuclease|nr:YraN family protein [Terriglobales bacterium]